MSSMVKITEIGLVIPGQVVRKFDGTDTTLTLSEEQARDMHESLAGVLQFFDAQKEQV